MRERLRWHCHQLHKLSLAGAFLSLFFLGLVTDEELTGQNAQTWRRSHDSNLEGTLGKVPSQEGPGGDTPYSLSKCQLSREKEKGRVKE